MEQLLRISDLLNRPIIAIGRWASWLVVPMIVITIWDVVTRKFIPFQLFITSVFGDVLNSTKLQEAEWHFHTALFALCIGFGYLRNSHVRVDIFREKLPTRRKAWIEFLGCLIFIIPYFLVVIYFATDFALHAYDQHEISASMIGIPHRWIIKSVLVIGLILTLLAGISMLIRKFVYLFGPSDLDFDLLTMDRTETSAQGGER